MPTATASQPTRETILQTADFEVVHYPTVDLTACYAFEVYDADDDLVFETDDRDEAITHARNEQEAIDAERAEERLFEMKNRIIDLVTDSEDKSILTRIYDMLMNH